MVSDTEIDEILEKIRAKLYFEKKENAYDFKSPFGTSFALRFDGDIDDNKWFDAKEEVANLAYFEMKTSIAKQVSNEIVRTLEENKMLTDDIKDIVENTALHAFIGK